MVSKIGRNIKLLNSTKGIWNVNNLRNVLIYLQNYSSSIEIICNLYFKSKRIPIVSIKLKNILFLLFGLKASYGERKTKLSFLKCFL
jgi:hypothetical protein